MRLFALIAVTFGVLAAAASAASIDGYIRMAPLKVPHDASVVLDGGRRSALVHNDGRFSFHNVAAGQYTLDVSVTGYHFDPVVVLVSELPAAAPKVFRLVAGSTTDRLPIPYPLQLRPDAAISHFAAREPFDVMSYLKQPMVIMVLIMGFMALVMPKLMGNMSPEELAEMRRMQSQMSISKLISGATGAPAPAQGRAPKRAPAVQQQAKAD